MIGCSQSVVVIAVPSLAVLAWCRWAQGEVLACSKTFTGGIHRRQYRVKVFHIYIGRRA